MKISNINYACYIAVNKCLYGIERAQHLICFQISL